jgi:hypothetical protein
MTALAWAACLFVVSSGLRLVINEINLASNYWLDPFTGGFFHTLFIGPATGGALAGYWTARLLKGYARLPTMRVFPIALVWAVAMLLGAFLPFIFGVLLMPPPQDPVPLSSAVQPPMDQTPIFLLLAARDFISWLIPGTLGGLVLAWEIRRGGIKMNWSRFALIIAGWGLGFALGGLIGAMLVGQLSQALFGLSDPGWLVNELFVWLSFGATGLIAGAAGAWATVQVIRTAAQTSENTLHNMQVSHP